MRGKLTNPTVAMFYGWVLEQGADIFQAGWAIRRDSPEAGTENGGETRMWDTRQHAVKWIEAAAADEGFEPDEIRWDD